MLRYINEIVYWEYGYLIPIGEKDHFRVAMGRCSSQNAAKEESDKLPTEPNFKDFEILGLDTDGTIVQWDESEGLAYNSGEKLDDIELDVLFDREKLRVGVL